MLSFIRKVHKRVFMCPIFIGSRYHQWRSSVIPSLAPKESQRRRPLKMWQMQIGWEKLNVTNVYRQKKINCLLNKWAIKMIACSRNTLSSAAACRGTSMWSQPHRWTPASPNPWAGPLPWAVREHTLKCKRLLMKVWMKVWKVLILFFGDDMKSF